MSTPLANMSVAAVWRRSWKRLLRLRLGPLDRVAAVDQRRDVDRDDAGDRALVWLVVLRHTNDLEVALLAQAHLGSGNLREASRLIAHERPVDGAPQPSGGDALQQMDEILPKRQPMYAQ
jgi:hypothetical protein